MLAALLKTDLKGLVSRRSASSILWEENDDKPASAALRQMLVRVRRAEALLGETVIAASAKSVWRGKKCVRSDLDMLLESAPVITSSQLSSLDALYRGDLLSGLEEAFGQNLTLMIGAARQRVRNRYLNLVVNGAKQVGGDVAENLLFRLLKEEPYDERIFRALVDVLNAGNRKQEIKELYDKFSARLHVELSVAPEISTQLAAQNALRTQRPDDDDRNSFIDRTRPGIPRLLILQPRIDATVSARVSVLIPALVDDIIIALCRERGFAVIAPHSAKQLDIELPEDAATSVGADYVTSSRIERLSSGKVSFTFRLTRNATGQVLVAEEFVFDWLEIVDRRRLIATGIASAMTEGIRDFESNQMQIGADPSAYAHFLAGNTVLQSIELANIRKARKHFKSAMYSAPHFAPAIAMFARTLTLEWVLLGRTENDLLDAALTRAKEAVQIDPFDASGYREVGHANIYKRRAENSIFYFSQAHERSPHFADLLADEADALVHNSRVKEANEKMEEAISLNPLPPDEYLWTHAAARFFLGDFPTALQIGERMKHPGSATRLLAVCAAMAGQRRKATKWREAAMARYPEFKVNAWADFVPIQDPEHRELYIAGLRLAGFPE